MSIIDHSQLTNKEGRIPASAASGTPVLMMNACGGSLESTSVVVTVVPGSRISRFALRSNNIVFCLTCPGASNAGSSCKHHQRKWSLQPRNSHCPPSAASYPGSFLLIADERGPPASTVHSQWKPGREHAWHSNQHFSHETSIYKNGLLPREERVVGLPRIRVHSTILRSLFHTSSPTPIQEDHLTFTN